VIMPVCKGYWFVGVTCM